MIDLGKATVTIEYAKLQELLQNRSAAVAEADTLRMTNMELEQKYAKLEAEIENNKQGSEPEIGKTVPGDAPVL